MKMVLSWLFLLIFICLFNSITLLNCILLYSIILYYMNNQFGGYIRSSGRRIYAGKNIGDTRFPVQ